MLCPLCYFILELDWDNHMMSCLLKYGVWVRFNDDKDWFRWDKPRRRGSSSAV